MYVTLLIISTTFCSSVSVHNFSHGVMLLLYVKLEWSMAWPAYYDRRYDQHRIDQWIGMSKEYSVENRKLPSGQVLMDNVRFFPFVYDNFETGDFSATKWRQNGTGGPWKISEENAIGRYSAHASPTADFQSGTSNLELTVDL